MVTGTVQVHESPTLGRWYVTSRYGNTVAITLNKNSASRWQCDEHGLVGETPCWHVRAVERHPQVTRCEYAEATGGGNAERACPEIAWGNLRLDGALVALCPDHYEVVRP